MCVAFFVLITTTFFCLTKIEPANHIGKWYLVNITHFPQLIFSHKHHTIGSGMTQNALTGNNQRRKEGGKESPKRYNNLNFPQEVDTAFTNIQ